jgi:DNA polymerase II small subunit/DNA polymerase delta subunit B
MYVTWTVDLKNGSRAQERTYLLDRQTNSPTTVSFLNIPCQGSDYSVNLPIEADVQERSIHLGQVNSFTEVLRSILQVLCKFFNSKANSKNDESRQALSLWAQSDTSIGGIAGGA